LLRNIILYIARLRARIRDNGLPGLFTSFSRRTWSSLFAFDEVLFFEWPAGKMNPIESCGLTLRQFDSDLLGAAAIRYVDDPATLDYLLRSAQRLRSEGDRGFVLLSAEGMPVHFCWAKDFDNFRMAELERTLQAPCAEAVMIFDCFTPKALRARGFFSLAIAALAGQLNSEGKAPWIFGAATNQTSLLGIEKSGFVHKFTLGRKRFLFHQEAKDSIPSPNPANIARSVPAP
jgi:hypothetical protein